jgi:hypothetical protein
VTNTAGGGRFAFATERCRKHDVFVVDAMIPAHDKAQVVDWKHDATQNRFVHFLHPHVHDPFVGISASGPGHD